MSSVTSEDLAAASRQTLIRRALWLAVFAVICDIAEGARAIVSAARAASRALIGFGVDSFAESASASVLI